MLPERDSEYEIVIEYDEFLTRLDFDEILTSIDAIIEEEILGYLEPESGFHPRPFPFRWSFRPGAHLGLSRPVFSYLGIKSITPGSVTLVVVVKGAVVAYVANRFRKGVDASILAEELERSGHLAGDFFGPLVRRINNWAERYVPKQKELGGKVNKIYVGERSHERESKKES